MSAVTLPPYEEFLARKRQAGDQFGFRPTYLPDTLFDFQAALVEWAVRQGRAALFEACGLGKTLQELVWAENVRRHTGRPVLILTPLAVGHQVVSEGEKFGIECRRSADGTVYPLTVTNYERLHHFSPGDFAGVVCDESSVLKSFDGVRRRQVTEFLRKLRYRLLGTATAAPNDYTELGTSSEALGYLGYVDMLNRWFKNEQGNCSTGRGYLGSENGWRFKGHAEEPFWRWVCSWARAIRKPSDLGFDDRRFTLPPLEILEHPVEARTTRPGSLFDLPAVGLQEQREERKRTLGERCERVAELVRHSEPALVWCHLNAEGDLLERLIPEAVQVSGSDPDEAKEARLLAFARGEVRVLITKPRIGCFGLNLQHCAHQTYFPSDSYEQWHQAVRRSWRFGQQRPVRVDVVHSEGEAGVLANLQRKSEAADRMFERLVAHMHEALAVQNSYRPAAGVEVPKWLS